MGELIGNLYWCTDGGVMLKLTQVDPIDFHKCGPMTLKGVPIVFSVWPTPVERKNDDETDDDE